MIEAINLMVMLTIFGTGVTAGILLTVQRLRHHQAELQAEKDQFAEEFFAAQHWACVGSRGGLGPSGIDPRDGFPV
jgi:hypothetical protein